MRYLLIFLIQFIFIAFVLWEVAGAMVGVR